MVMICEKMPYNKHAGSDYATVYQSQCFYALTDWIVSLRRCEFELLIVAVAKLKFTTKSRGYFQLLRLFHEFTLALFSAVIMLYTH